MSQATPVPAAARDRPRIVLGAMSGTSADGVDVAAAEVTGRGLGMLARYLGHVEHPYDADLRRRIFALRESGACRMDELAGLGRDITLAYAEATRALMERMSLRPSQVAGLAAHGQTLYHAPPESIQWLDPALLASRTDLAVISDFRRADLSAGGQGAPLVPFADWILFRHPRETRVILNLGGIANLTYLPAGGGIEDVVAFDTGPGNCISDWICRSQLGKPYDAGGSIALSEVRSIDFTRALWEVFSQDEFINRAPPKSTDVPTMIGLYERARRAGLERHPDATAEDELRAAAYIVAFAVQAGLMLCPAGNPYSTIAEVRYAGGGAKNEAILRALRYVFDQPKGYGHDALPLLPLDVWLPSQAREAVAFAILGAATLDGEPSNVPSATGAARRVVLGSITPRPGGL